MRATEVFARLPPSVGYSMKVIYRTHAYALEQGAGIDKLGRIPPELQPKRSCFSRLLNRCHNRTPELETRGRYLFTDPRHFQNTTRRKS